MLYQQYYYNNITVPRPITIKYNVYDTNTLYYNMPNIVYLPNDCKHIMPHFIPNHFISNIMLETIEQIFNHRMIYKMNSIHPNSTRMIQEFIFENQSHATILLNQFSEMNLSNVKYYIDDKLNILLVSPNYTAIIMEEQALLFKNTKEQIYANNKQLYVKLQNTTFMYNVNENNFTGIIYSNNMNEKMNIIMSDNNNN